MIRSVLNTLAYEFGFTNFSDFVDSLIHTKLMAFTIPLAFSIAGVVTFLENNLGMQVMTMTALLALLVLELVTGLWGAKASKTKIESRKFARFGLKVIVWFTLFFIMNSLTIQYEDEKGLWSKALYTIFSWSHGTLMVYVTLEYFISVLENFSKITGRDTSPITRAIRKQLDKWFGSNEESDFFEDNNSLLAIANSDGKFLRLNNKWVDILGHSIEDMLSHPWLYYVHPEDMQSTIDEMNNIEEGKETLNFINRFRRSDGQYVKLSWNTKPVNAGEKWHCTVRVLEQPMKIEEHLVK